MSSQTEFRCQCCSVFLCSLCFFLFSTTTLKRFVLLLLLSTPHLSYQDDSDDETPAVRRPHGHSDTLEYMDLSAEEGEETASSEAHSEVPQSVLFFFQLGDQSSFYSGHFLNYMFCVCVQENDLDGSELDSSNDEEEWKSDSSR